MNKLFVVHLVYIESAAPAVKDALFRELQRSMKWHRSSEAVWFLYTHESAERIFARLHPEIPSGVALLVSEVCGAVRGSLDAATDSWIARHLPMVCDRATECSEYRFPWMVSH